MNNNTLPGLSITKCPVNGFLDQLPYSKPLSAYALSEQLRHNALALACEPGIQMQAAKMIEKLSAQIEKLKGEK